MCSVMTCREAVLAVVNGADINAGCMGPAAVELIRDTNALGGGADAEPATTTENLTALHFACQVRPQLALNALPSSPVGLQSCSARMVSK